MKKLLLVEIYHHPKVLESLFHLLNDKVDLTYMVNEDHQDSFEKLFPSMKKSKVKINKLHSSTLLIWVFFAGWKYDYINISTGPEGSHWTDILNVIFFWLICKIYRKKIILTCKHLRPYFRSSPGLFSFIRSRAITNIPRFSFETKTMLEVFKKHAVVNSDALMGVQYDRYVDQLPQEIEDKRKTSSEGKCRIGLLGVVLFARRDYQTVIAAVKSLNETERANLEFVTLGACFEGEENEVIKALSPLVKIDYIKGVISEDEFNERGISCDALLSPMTYEMEYGRFMGSGSFGDSYYLGKRLIIPNHVDEGKEWNQLAYYYSNKNELASVFRKLSSQTSESIDDTYRSQFMTKNVFEGLCKDLQLQ